MHRPHAPTPARRPRAFLPRLSLGAAIALTASTHSLAVIIPPPPPPTQSDPCSESGSSSQDNKCPATANGGFNQAVTSQGTAQIGGIVSGAVGNFGNQLNGGNASGPGAARFALSGETGTAAAGMGEKWNAWLALSHNRIGYSFAPLQSSGHVDVALVGVDYTFGNTVILGAALSGERMRVATTFNGGNLAGNGNTFAPYLAWAINRNWVLDAALGFGSTSLDTNTGGATGNTRDRRSFASLGLSYNRAMGKWQLTGKGQVMAAEDRIGQYTLSNNTTVQGSSARTTQLRLGGQAAYNLGNGVVPWFGLTYIYDADRTAQAPLAGQNAANDRDAVLVQVGLNIQSKGRLYGGVTLSSEQGRSQVKNDQVLFNIGMRF